MTHARTAHRRAPYDELRARTTGTVAVAGDAEYDALVTPWNLADRRPARRRRSRPATAQDVVEAVRFAGRHGLLVTPQATGHGAIAALVGRAAGQHQGARRVRRPPRGGLGPRRRRREVAARRRGGRAVRPGAAVRLDHRRRHRRLHHRRRPRADGPHLRPRHRPGPRDRGRHRRRRAAPGHARPSTRTCSSRLRGGKGALGIVTAIEFDLVEQPTFYGGALWFDGDARRAVIDARGGRGRAELPEAATTSFALFQLPDDAGRAAACWPAG